MEILDYLKPFPRPRDPYAHSLLSAHDILHAAMRVSGFPKDTFLMKNARGVRQAWKDAAVWIAHRECRNLSLVQIGRVFGFLSVHCNDCVGYIVRRGVPQKAIMLVYAVEKILEELERTKPCFVNPVKKSASTSTETLKRTLNGGSVLPPPSL